MLDEKQKIEDNIKFLVAEKNTMEHHIEEQEKQVLKTKFLLAPLTEKVSNLETELSSLTNGISEKQEELTTLKMKIVEAGGVSVSSEEKTGPALLGPILGISLLLNLIVIISLFLAFTSDRQEDDQFQRKEKISGAVVREPEPVSFLSESFSQYPMEVQEAINRLKSQYDLEDGDIETVVNKLWSDPP